MCEAAKAFPHFLRLCHYLDLPPPNSLNSQLRFLVIWPSMEMFALSNELRHFFLLHTGHQTLTAHHPTASCTRPTLWVRPPQPGLSGAPSQGEQRTVFSPPTNEKLYCRRPELLCINTDGLLWPHAVHDKSYTGDSSRRSQLETDGREMKRKTHKKQRGITGLFFLFFFFL